MRKVLLFGRTGKMGTALSQVLTGDFQVAGVNSRDLDVADLTAVETLIEARAPDIVINTVARLGIDDCERNPEPARCINALFPARLAALSTTRGFRLVHFSTETVFSGKKGTAYTESDAADPVNVYGATKLEGDRLVLATAPDALVFRLPVLFGFSPKRNQLVERMIARARSGGETLRVAADIRTSPTYALDAAYAVRAALEEEAAASGLYHLANAGEASLFDLVSAVMADLGLAAEIVPASYRDFPSLGRKNTVTPLASERRAMLRPWREAVSDYCAGLLRMDGTTIA